MTDILDEAATIQRKVQFALARLEATYQRLLEQRRSLAKVENGGDGEGMLRLAFVEGEKEKRLGREFQLPLSVVRLYLTSEVERLEKELVDLIAPFRALTLGEIPESPLWQVIKEYWGNLDAAANLTRGKEAVEE